MLALGRPQDARWCEAARDAFAEDAVSVSKLRTSLRWLVARPGERKAVLSWLEDRGAVVRDTAKPASALGSRPASAAYNVLHPALRAKMARETRETATRG